MLNDEWYGAKHAKVRFLLDNPPRGPVESLGFSGMFKGSSMGFRDCAKWVPLSLGAISIVGTHRAYADGGDAFVELRWHRGPAAQSCPAQAEVEQLVRLRLGRNPFTLNAPRTIDASIDRLGSRWHVELHQRDATGPIQGERVFDIPEDSCSQVADAVGLAVALAIDPNASIASLTDSPPPPAADLPHDTQPAYPPPRTPPWTSAPAPQNPPPLAFLPPPAPQPREVPYTVQLSLRGVLAGGLLPGAAPGLAVAGAVGGRYLTFTLGTTYFPEASTEFKGSRFSFGLTTLDVGLCGPGLRTRDFTLSNCTQFHGGALHAVVWDAQPKNPGDHFLWALSTGPRAVWRSFAPLMFEAGAAAWITPNAPTYSFGKDFYQVRLLSILGYFGVGWTSP